MSRWRVGLAREPFAELADQPDPEAWLEARALEVHRDLPARRTFRFEHAGGSWFAKIHRGVGLRELLKNALVLRLPVFDARAEVRAIAALEAAGVPTLEVFAWGTAGHDPLRRRSFLVTREIAHDCTVDALLRSGEPTVRARRRLIAEVAALVRAMHDAGVNHRDLYLVHLLHTEGGRLRLIDLHRAQLRERVPERWLGKDLAALAFSAAATGALGERDRLRFLRAYGRRPLRELLARQRGRWRDVRRREARMARRGARG